MRFSATSVLLAVTLAAPANPAGAAGQVAAQTTSSAGVASMAAYRLAATESIRLDGEITEALWGKTQGVTGFTQRDPVEGEAATERTEVFVVYDAQRLYIGAILYDSDPDGILAFQKERDAPLFTDDRFMWILDTFHDGRTGYFFETNPAGLMGDGLIGGGGRGGFGVNKSWDGIWEARAARRPDGWSVEVAIPFRTLNFDPNLDTWGINFQRTVRRKSEESLWTGHRRTQQLTRPVHAGDLTGLGNLSQGLGLEATPYAITGWQNTPNHDPTVTDVDATDFPADVGLDLSYNVTTSLRAAVTVNTDFAEVEVDQRRVNLTRFPLRFPEQRDFFLEGSGVFSFAPRNGVTPFFSRNIGLRSGNPVPITYGARLGGQSGRYEVGFLQVRTGRLFAISADQRDTTRAAAEDFTAARIKRTLFRQSSLGAVYTRRASGTDPTDGSRPPDRHTVGVDLDLFTSTFLENKNLQFEAFLVYNTVDAFDDTTSIWDRTARGARINFPNDVWRIHTSYRELASGHRPALGFTPRNGFRRLQPTVAFAPRPGDLLGLRQLEFQVQYEHLMDMDWRLETRKTDFKPLGLRFHSGDRFDIDLTQLYERLDGEDAVSLSDNLGAVVPAGRYTMWRWRVSGRSAGRRRVSGRFELSGGDFWTGSRRQYEASVTVRPVPGISVGTEFETNRITLDDAEPFSTSVYRIETGWHFSPWTSFTGNLQYDDQSELLGLFARFRWIISPGNDLFIVHTYNWQNRNRDDPRLATDFVTISRGLTTKLNYTHRF